MNARPPAGIVGQVANLPRNAAGGSQHSRPLACRLVLLCLCLPATAHPGRGWWFACLVCLVAAGLLAAGSAAPAHAQGAITATNPKVESKFADHITYSVTHQVRFRYHRGDGVRQI